MTFFFDRNISPRIARMVAAYEDGRHTICHHDERFDRRTTDVEWIAALGKDREPSVVISGDGGILRNKAEKTALWEANLTFHCMPKQWMHMPFPEQAWKFIRVWPQIVDSADILPPRIFEVSVGQVPKVSLSGTTRH